MPDIQKDAQSYVEIRMAEFLANLAPRTHTVKMTMIAGMQNLYETWEVQIANDTKVEIAKGEVKINMSGVDTEALKGWVNTQKVKYEDKLANERQLPGMFTKPNKIYQDATFESNSYQSINSKIS